MAPRDRRRGTLQRAASVQRRKKTKHFLQITPLVSVYLHQEQKQKREGLGNIKKIADRPLEI
jgi:hypothetical protein